MDEDDEIVFWLLLLGPCSTTFVGVVLVLWACGVFG